MMGRDSMLTLLIYLRERKTSAEDIIIIECVAQFDEELLQCLSEWYELRSLIWSAHFGRLPAQRTRRYMVLIKRRKCASTVAMLAFPVQVRA